MLRRQRSDLGTQGKSLTMKVIVVDEVLNGVDLL